MDFSAKLGFVVVDITGTLFVFKNGGWRLQDVLGHPVHRDISLLQLSLHTMAMLPWQILNHSFPGNSTCLLNCFLENRAFIRCTDLESGNCAGVCKKSKCGGVLRLGYKNDDLQSFLKHFCGTGALLKCFSYDTSETYFWEDCSWGSSVHVFCHRRNECSITLVFLFLSVFQSLLFIAVMYSWENELMIQYIPPSFLPLHCGLGVFLIPLYVRLQYLIFWPSQEVFELLCRNIFP